MSNSDYGLGYVQVYTGDGKGKTTAAIGLAIRALGSGKRVLFLQFMKDMAYSEHAILKSISPNLILETVGKPFFVAKEGEIDDESLAKIKGQVVVFSPGEPPGEYLEIVARGMEKARQAINGGDFDLVILDEINVTLHFGLVTLDEVMTMLDQKAPGVEVVLTGRGAPPELIARADLVTEMREVKHYYQKGVIARKGIES